MAKLLANRAQNKVGKCLYLLPALLRARARQHAHSGVAPAPGSILTPPPLASALFLLRRCVAQVGREAAAIRHKVWLVSMLTVPLRLHAFCHHPT